jgi:hypothetical protein
MTVIRADVSVIFDYTSDEGLCAFRIWVFIVLCCRPVGAPLARLRPLGGPRWVIVPAMGVPPVCSPFMGNGRAIAPNVRGTVNGRAMCLSVARTPALKKAGMLYNGLFYILVIRVSKF